jgi:hypothetical protein
MDKPQIDNGAALRDLIAAAGITQAKALELVNEDQAFPIAESTWKSYLAAGESKRRRACPDKVLARALRVIGQT